MTGKTMGGEADISQVARMFSDPVPVILHGYGAFGVSQTPDYYAVALAWAERGGIFATACVRGGGENGARWHEAGARQHKQQGIDDFLAAARYLVDSGLTRPEMLAAMGDSAGGLLVAAAITQRPELFAAAACTAPLTDMARYELGGMGAYWTDEFGSRNDYDELGWLLGYSPYHAVQPGVAYSAVLLTTFAGDTRVDAAHARKMCAALQHASSADPVARPILLLEEEGVGHGDRARSRRMDHFAEVMSFLANATGLASTPIGPAAPLSADGC